MSFIIIKHFHRLEDYAGKPNFLSLPVVNSTHIKTVE